MRREIEIEERRNRCVCVLRLETSRCVFPAVVMLTAVIHRDRRESTSPAENHRELEEEEKQEDINRMNFIVVSNLFY